MNAYDVHWRIDTSIVYLSSDRYSMVFAIFNKY